MIQSQQGDLKSAIELALTTGATLALDYEQILQNADADSTGDPVIVIDIGDFDSKAANLSALSQATGVLGGQSIGALVPNGILPAADITVQNVSFKLFAGSKTVGSVSCTIAFFDKGGNNPLTWDIVTLDPGSSNPAKLSVTLDTITLTWVNPLQAQQMFGAIIYGSATIGSLPLTVSITFPDFTLTIEETPHALVNVGEFFTQLKLPDVGFLDNLVLQGFQLTANPGQGSFAVAASMETAGPPPLALLIIGGKTVLGFDNMAFSLSHASGTTSGQIGGQVTVLDALVLDVQAALDTDPQSGSWTFEGDIDIPASWQNLPANKGKPLPAKPQITVADLMHIFIDDSVNPPSALPVLGIAALSFSYTRTRAGDDKYALNGEFDLEWKLADDVKAAVTVALGSDGNSVSAVFDLDGVAFTLSYSFSKASSDISATIVVGDVLSMTGTYGGDTLTLKFVKCPSLADFIGWLVGEVSGNRYFTLPDPWDSVLGDFKIPSGLEFTIKFSQTKKQRSSITCNVPINNVNLLGVSLTGFDISYNPPLPGSSGSGLTFGLTTSMGNFNWDPVKQQPPTVPGSKAALLDIKLLAAGQHIGFPVPPPTTVEDAIKQLVTALDPASWTGGLYPGGLTFSPDIGWLIGTSVTLLGQLDLKFIFNDPAIYGLSLIVNKSTSTSSGADNALDVLAGLSVEIVYRKISDTVGVYEGTLTLPSDIRTINLNQVVITLPQFSLSIYTNGDFSFDAGFPYNGDFSQSLSVVAAEYAGAGGFYYAKLDGLDPAELPQIPSGSDGQPAGVFSPVTEIGIGFQIGASKSFSSGPLSASCSIMLLGIFQGVFAKYTQYSNGSQDEFYSVDATLGIVGHLVGEINFIIITATLEVTLSIEVELKLIAHQPTTASISVYVDVELTVSINCGLFTIHVHCGFSTTLHTQATFGGKSTALWDDPSAGAQSLLLGDSVAFSVVWQPISDTNPLTLYFMPQLTAGALYPPSGQQTSWYYVGQLGLSNPTTGTTVNTDPSYENFVSGMLLWALNAIGKKQSDTPISRAEAEAKAVTAQDVRDLNEALKDLNNAARPTRDIIEQQFKSAFQFNVTTMLVSRGNYGVGFFPAVPGMAVVVQPEGQPAITRAPAMLSPAQLQQARSGRSAGAPRATLLAHLRDQPSVLSATAQSSAELVLIDFAVLAITLALGKIIDEKIIPDDPLMMIKQSKMIKDVIAAVKPELGNISGMTTRFMLHGARRDVGGVTEPLYAALGQQVPLNAAALAAANLTMTLTSETPADWGITFPGGAGATALSLSSSDKNPAVFKPKTQIPASPQFTPSNVVASAMLAANRPVCFYLKTGIADSGSQSVLWQVPQTLADHLAQAAGNETFKIYQYQPNDAKILPKAVAGNFVFTLDFRVRRVPDGSGVNLPNTYELVDVDQGSLQSLQTLVTAKTCPVTGLALAYAHAPDSGSGKTSRQAAITPIDFSTNNTFIVQSNFSTQTNPPPDSHPVLGVALSDTDTAKISLFLTKLWTAGITNSGGYFLFDTALPDSGLFDGSGRATLTLVASLVDFDGTTPVSLAPYVTGVQILNTNVDSSAALYVASYIDGQAVTAPRAILPSGNVGIEVTCDAPLQPPVPTGGDGDYGNALEHLYNLITAESISLTTYDDAPPVFGPINQNGEEGASTWQYRHVSPLVPAWPEMSTKWPTDPVPPPQYDPYSAVGKEFSVDWRWTDVFGNQWPVPVVDPAKAQWPVQYTDPLISLSQLPYLTLDYRYNDPGTGARLGIGILFTPPKYLNNVSDDTRKAHDLASYAQAYYQLGDPDFAVTITSSLLVASGQPVPITVTVDTIRKNVLAIYAYLLAFPLGGPAPDKPTLVPIIVAVPPNGVQICGKLKYPLTVALTFTRPKASVAAPFLNGPVETISTTIAPYTAAVGSDSHSLVPFAKAFERTFQAHDLAIAVGPSAGQGLTANSRQVWVVHYGKSGLTIKFENNDQKTDHPANFAPRPLSNQLQSRSNVQVKQIDSSNGNLIAGNPAGVTVTNVDLDAQMQKFLAAVDLMFSATDAIPTALINPDAIDSLAKSKEAIVASLVNYVTDLRSGDSYGDKKHDASAPISAAADRYKQECLIRLSAFYDMDAVTVPTITASVGTSEDSGLYVFGHLKVPDSSTQDDGKVKDPSAPDVETEFSLTSGKCALATAVTPMAIGVFAKHVSNFSKYACEPSFVIDAIQHDVTPVSIDGATYEVGAWLTFVIPRADLTMPALAIPIALRAFPQPPQLMAQTAVELLADIYAPPSDDNANLRLLLAKTWSLDGSYQHTYAAQDTVHLKVEINIAPASSATPMVGATGGRDLIETLIEFNLNYASLQAIFAANHLDTIRTPPDKPTKGILFNALNSFATLVDAVAGANWPAKPQQAMRQAVGDALVARESQYQIHDGYKIEANSDPWKCAVMWEQDLKDPVGFVPQLQIDNWKTVLDKNSEQSDTTLIYAFVDPDPNKSETFLLAEQAEQIQSRTVAVMPPYDYLSQNKPFTPLDIVDSQNGLLSMMIGRNESLPAPFQYQTPWVTYTEIISPTLDTAVAIDIAGIGQPNGQAAPRSIVDHLTALFSALMTVAGSKDAVTSTFQAIMYFAYPPNTPPAGAEALALVELPIALRLPTETDTTGYVADMAKAITDWLTANGLSATQRSELWKRSELRFDLSLFSDASLTGRPILRLRSLFIQCKEIV
jgi:hypothetical protein